MKFFVAIFLVVSSVLAVDYVTPGMHFQASGSVVDMVHQEGKLYVATNASAVDIFELKTAKRLSSIKVPRIIDFMGDSIDSKVYSIDVYKERIVLLSQGNQGLRRFHLYEKGKLSSLALDLDNFYCSKLKFLDSTTLIMASLGNELLSYDMKEKKINWRIQVSHSKFSDLVLNENKSEAVVADESGDLKIFSTQDGRLIDTLSGENLDNVFQIDYKNGIIATAGQDRRVVVYDVANFSAYYKSSSFLIYSVGLSPGGEKVAYASDEDNNVRVFNAKTKETLGDFTGNKMTLTKILFLDEKQFLVSSDSSVINLFQVK